MQRHQWHPWTGWVHQGHREIQQGVQRIHLQPSVQHPHRVYSAAHEPIEIYNETTCIDGQTVDRPESKK